MSYKILHLDQDETVVLEVRKHWIVFVGHALVLFLAMLFPFVIYKIFSIFTPAMSFPFLVASKPALYLFFYSMWVLVLWAYFFINWTKYYLDAWYVTERRIIIVEQKRLFDREVSNLHFDKIQDVTLDVHGFLSTILNFGNINVQTAGEDSKKFAIKTVRHPELIRKIIFSHQNRVADK